jgi:formyl transferase-like protein
MQLGICSTRELAPLGGLNAHTSLLPDYRGAHPEFWQVLDSAYDKTGISLHFVDDGLDTGDVVYRRRVPITNGTDPWMLRALNTIQILIDYPRVIGDVLAGTYLSTDSSTRARRSIGVATSQRTRGWRCGEGSAMRATSPRRACRMSPQVVGRTDSAP